MADRDPIIPEGYHKYATKTQMTYIEAVNETGSYRAAERLLFGTDETDKVGAALRRMFAAAAAQGFAPDHDYTHTVPAPFVAKGVSTHYVTDKETGQVRVGSQWVKSRLDDGQYRIALEAAFAAMSDDLPRLDPLQRPLTTKAKLLNLYTLTDCHVGMLAWRHEGGKDWDLKIAERTLFDCFEQMVASAPPAETCVINQLGDFLHTDGLEPVTPTGHNVLDADGRFSKMVAIAVRLLRRMVDLALMKHERVIVLLAEGNHDMASSVWLRVMFKALYENEPRVEVIETPLPYYAVQHGQTMLGFHHGHLKKPDLLTAVMAAQFAPIWGATTKRYAHMGHMHSLYEREHAGMVVTQHPTLAPRDAYAARGGWFNESAATVVTYHDEFGQVAKTTVTPEMVN